MGLIKKFADYAGVKHEIHLDSVYDMVSNVKTSLRTLLEGKAASNHTHSTSESWLSTIVNNLTTLINGKAASSTTLAGYGITDAYTKTEADNKLQNKTNMTFTDENNITSGINCMEGNESFIYLWTQYNGEEASISILFNDDGTRCFDINCDEISGDGVTDDLSSTATIEKKIPTSGAVKAALNGKANVSTTLAGYGITNAYTKTEVDTALDGKANSSHTHPISQVTNLSEKLNGLVVFDMSSGLTNLDILFSSVHAGEEQMAAQIMVMGVNKKLSQILTSSSGKGIYYVNGVGDVYLGNDDGVFVTVYNIMSSQYLVVLDSYITDNTPTQNSARLITSGGVYAALHALEARIAALES